MQKENFVVNSGSGVALWRGIPAQITIAGIEDVSGDWLFLVDNDFSDGVILSGTVAADNGTLTVTLENMNTVELAAAIDGRSVLQCRATLTDGTSRVYIVPLTIRNRAVSGTPTPVAEYYTKAQIDAIIAAIPTGTGDYTELTNKPAINGHTLTGDQTAEDLGLLPNMDIEAMTSAATVTIASNMTLYTIIPDQNVSVNLPTPGQGKFYFWLYITMPATAYTITFPAGVDWGDAGIPDMSSASKLYRLSFMWDIPAQKWLANEFWPAADTGV